jgi:hypothetical protein
MSHLRHALALLLFTSTLLSGCLSLGDEEPDEEQCATIFELCPEGSQRVDACAPGARCVLKNTCGGAEGTICQYDGDVQCKALPVCDEGEQELGRCGADELCDYPCAAGAQCHAVSGCGETVFCQRDMIHCAAIPTCDEGFEQVPACADNGLDCQALSVCDTTIYCQEQRNTCNAYPTCPAGAVEVESCDDDLYVCSTATLCGQTIQCEHRGPLCDAIPVCPLGFKQVPDCADNGSNCDYVTACGQTIACQEERATCLAVPTCPAGGQQVMACQPNAAVECQDVTLCGQTITCQFSLGCAPQDARGVGDCSAFFGYAWDGSACIGLGGCSCEGDDCDQTYQSPEACEMAHAFCQP